MHRQSLIIPTFISITQIHKRTTPQEKCHQVKERCLDKGIIFIKGSTAQKGLHIKNLYEYQNALLVLYGPLRGPLEASKRTVKGHLLRQTTNFMTSDLKAGSFDKFRYNLQVALELCPYVYDCFQELAKFTVPVELENKVTDLLM